MIRVLIADGHDGTRHSISDFLTEQGDFTICGEAVDGVQVVEQARKLEPDAIVMDDSIPKMDGLTAATVIRRENPSAKIVIISLKEPSILKQMSSHHEFIFIDKTNVVVDLVPTLRHLTKYAGKQRPA